MEEMISSSITDGGDIPDDLVSDILSMLSVKSIIRFRSVCKSWDALTKDPNFIKSHMSHQSAMTDHNTNMILNYRCTVGFHLEYSFPSAWNKTNGNTIVNHDCNLGVNVAVISNYTFRETFALKTPLFSEITFPRMHMFGPCNGIVCLRGSYGKCPSWIYEPPDGASLDNLALWNPASREIKVLPLSKFGPSSDPFVLLGHDHTRNDYKVVMILHEYVEVYSLNENSWKSIETNMPVNVPAGSRFDYLRLNEFCYWASYDGNKGQMLKVMAFDMINETFSEIAVPPEIRDHSIDEYYLRRRRAADDLFVHNGSLCIGEARHARDILRIWVMVEEKERRGSTTTDRWWIQQSEVALSTYYNLSMIRENGDMIVQCFDDGRLKLYDSSRFMFKPLYALGAHTVIDRIMFCPETLVSLNTT